MEGPRKQNISTVISIRIHETKLPQPNIVPGRPESIVKAKQAKNIHFEFYTLHFSMM